MTPPITGKHVGPGRRGDSEVSYCLNSRPLIHLCSSSSPDITLKDIFKMKIRAISLIPKTHCSRAKVKVQVAF